MDCSPPGSSVHGIIQARILEWVTISFFILCALVMVITDCDCRSMHLHKHPGNPMQAHDICIGVREGGPIESNPWEKMLANQMNHLDEDKPSEAS